MKEIAWREGVDDSYVSRMVILTTLTPDLVVAILDETLPPEVTVRTGGGDAGAVGRAAREC